ncbi:DUF421 domain-containing protein [Amphibacillus sp. MSJ-3]|uniref:DUF421 domain-containing protein n=1 Tax=Amphibacillus sp. MSJ-3 TaxID=2841505 RepID=UPI001C0F22DF|nr:DUF421 domain-containing protein [Amphibacillus sp. MSJ-3]MBU5593573.1 DUF421 domain-containing protein [Amphibacillus sp. MSJ-3]
MWIIISRTIITYCFIAFFFRLMGKREIGELSLLDIVISIMMAEIAVIVIEDTDKGILTSLIPMLVLVIIQRTTALISLKSKRFRDWFEGKPSLIILNGRINKDEMRKHRYNFDDLIQQLHEKSVKSVQDVEYAILEPSGKLSVFAKERAVSVGFVHLLIADGKIQDHTLDVLKKSRDWLMEELGKQGYYKLEDILYCTIDSADQWYIDLEKKR